MMLFALLSPLGLLFIAIIVVVCLDVRLSGGCLEEPQFFTTRRNKEIALWVLFPDGSRRNIWDLEDPMTPNVEDAIINSFMRGAEYMRHLINHSLNDYLRKPPRFERRDIDE